MKKEWFSTKLFLFAGLALLFAFAAHAAEKDCREFGGRKHHRMKYDLKTVETVSGEVLKVREFTHRRGAGTGISLVLKTEKEEIPVQIGPSSFLEKEGFKFSEKDKLEVTGSRVTGKRGKTFLLAAQVKKGDSLLKLRDEKGFPIWAPMKGEKMRKGGPAPETEPKPEMKEGK
ncbi:MAG: hypothetical protein HY896_07460 [Deltaproteobacteria bacterium]|nr:hypothetical protein [Deltaproteobacteria bacterium]